MAVIALETPDNLDADKVIVCCFTTKDPSVTENHVRNYAKERLLPHVLSLTRFRRLDQLPLTTNGKVDRIKLESMIGPQVEQASQTPSQALTVREKILAMWEQLRGR